MDDNQLYRGFSPEKQAEFENWIVDRAGEPHRPGIRASIDQSAATMKDWSAEQRSGFGAEFEAIERVVAQAMADGFPADSEALSAVLKRHHAWVAQGWGAEPNAIAYKGLAELYAAHPEFRARFEAVRPGLTDYFTEAMRRFAENALK